MLLELERVDVEAPDNLYAFIEVGATFKSNLAVRAGMDTECEVEEVRGPEMSSFHATNELPIEVHLPDRQRVPLQSARRLELMNDDTGGVSHVINVTRNYLRLYDEIVRN